MYEVRITFEFLLQELGHDPGHWQLQMDHNRQVHILPRSQSDDDDPIKVSIS